MNWTGLVPTAEASASQDTVDAKKAGAKLVSKLDTIIQRSEKNLQGVDWSHALQRFFFGAAGTILAVLCGILYYTAFFPVLSEQLGCRCDWDPLWQAILIVLGILPLALWRASKFYRF